MQELSCTDELFRRQSQPRIRTQSNSVTKGNWMKFITLPRTERPCRIPDSNILIRLPPLYFSSYFLCLLTFLCFSICIVAISGDEMPPENLQCFKTLKSSYASWQSWRVQTSSEHMHFSCGDFGSLCNSLPILESFPTSDTFGCSWCPLFASDIIRPFWKSSPGASSAADDDEEGVKVKTPEALVTQHTAIKALCSISRFSASFASYAWLLLSLLALFSLLWWWGWWTGFILSPYYSALWRLDIKMNKV